jgi:hypothetical protein
MLALDSADDAWAIRRAKAKGQIESLLTRRLET